ncbi:MAG: hypothetical protein ACYTA5_09730 [Planctomycetota bacterium]
MNVKTCGHYGMAVYYTELFLDDDRAPTDFVRVDCGERPPFSEAPSCNCSGGDCTSVCSGGTCTNGAGSCTVDDDCKTCDDGPKVGMPCTEDLDCSGGPIPGPQVLQTSDGSRHNSIAIGLVALLDTSPCDWNADYGKGPQARPDIWRLVIFDGLTWNQFKASNFVDLPATPGADFPDSEFWDLRPWNKWNIVTFAIGADYIEVRLYNNRAEWYHDNGSPGACEKSCSEKSYLCRGGPWHGWGCSDPGTCSGSVCVGGADPGKACSSHNDCPDLPDDSLCEGVGPYSNMPPLPNPYFVARVPRQDDPDGNGVYGPFNKIAIGPGKGLNVTAPTCINYGTELDPWRRCWGGDNEGGVCTTDADCPPATTEECLESWNAHNIVIDEVVLYDGVFETPPGIQGACCQPNTACVVTTEDDCLNNLNGVYQGNLVPCTDYLCCYDPFADADNDGDVDQDDFALFQKCYVGDGAGPPTAECKCFDQVGTGLGTPPDDDVDDDDFQAFEQCASTSGPNVPHNPACDD